MSSAPVHAVIVNYRTAKFAVRCLAALAQERASLPGLAATLIDNDSGDDSMSVLQDALQTNDWGSWLKLHPNPTNVGFGAGNNIGIRPGLEDANGPRFFLLINPDVEIYPGAVAAMVEFLEQQSQAAMVGPLTEVGRDQPRGSAFRFPTILSALVEGLRFGPITRLLARWEPAPPPQAQAHPTDWISGGCMLIRRTVLETVGLFDESFFLYFEETDLCKRAGKQGLATWFLPSARVVHDAGAATGVTGAKEGQKPMPRYWFESRATYLRKHHGLLYKWACDLVFIGARSLDRIRGAILRRRDPDPPHFLRDFVAYNLFGR